MNKPALITLTLVIGFLIGTNLLSIAEKERTPEEWIQSMNKAKRELNYEGIISFFDGVDMSSMDYLHALINGSQYVRVRHLNNPRYEVIRTDTELKMVVTQDDGDLAGGPIRDYGVAASRLHQAHFDSVQESYDFVNLGLERIADRDGIRIGVQPKEQDRHSFVFVVDIETSLLLRSEMRDPGQNIMNVLQFTNLKVLESPPTIELFTEIGDGDVIVSLVKEKKQPKEPVNVPSQMEDWQVGWVPPGFSVSTVETTNSFYKGRTRVYSDGLISFSVLVEKLPSLEEEMQPFEAILGSTVAVSRSLKDNQGSLNRVYVIGELPRSTIWRIVQNVRFVP